MESLGVLRFWRSAATGAETRSDVGDARSTAFATDDDEETDGEDELFDLIFDSPNHDDVVKGRDEALKKDFLLRGIDFSNSKPTMSPVAILRSAQKLKVKFVLGFRKSSKCQKGLTYGGDQKASPLWKSSSNGRVADLSVAPVFARDNSLRSKILEGSDFETPSSEKSEKSVPKYLKLIKPLYIKVSKKVKLTDSTMPATALMNPLPRKFSQGYRLGNLKIVPRNLRKSRSASAVVGVDMPSVGRKDDSLLQQHDGIQSAILHCKKSYNSSSEEFSQLFQSSNDPLRENLKGGERNSGEEQNRGRV